MLALFWATACARNNVDAIPLTEASEAGQWSAVVVFGMERHPGLDDQHYSVGFDRYDPDAGKLDADCWVYDRIRASIKGPITGIQYFAFRVPAGFYSGSLLTSSPMVTNGLTPSSYPYFEAPAGALVYLGDFVFGKRTVQSRGFKGAEMVSIASLSVEADARRVAQVSDALKISSDRLLLAKWHWLRNPPGPIICYF